MRASIYDGRRWQPCSVDDARAALQTTDLSWIDIRLSGLDDPDAPPMLTALGVDPTATLAALRTAQGTDFQLTPSQIEGTAWLAGDTAGAPTQARFAFDTHRLVTIRLDGDTAFATVQTMLAARADLAIKEPSRMLGFVLQAMQSTIQQSLTQAVIQVGLLDLDVMATSVPDPQQGAQLVSYRAPVLPFASRFPAYVVNLRGALLDPDTITVIDQAGVNELQSLVTVAESTSAILNSLIDALRTTGQDIQGQVSNWQGQRINQLTVVTFIFLPITFLTGYFGMNFQWLDNQLLSSAAYVLLGLVLPILMAAFSIVFLARRGFRVWLRSRRGMAQPRAPHQHGAGAPTAAS